MYTQPDSLVPSDIAAVKCVPVSQFGLDLCDPSQRLLVVQYMLSLMNYVESGQCKVGDY